MNDVIFKKYLIGENGKDGKSYKKKDQKHDNQTFEEVSQYKNYGAIMNDGFVDISFDSQELSDSFMDMCEAEQWNCLVLENPSNGHIHTYWKDTEHRIKKKSMKDTVLAVGLIADIHSGNTYIPFSRNGVKSLEVFDRDPAADYDEVPEELIPVNTKKELWNMRDGDGRNNELFGYMNVLVNDVTEDETVLKRIVNNINKFIFTEPLEESEIETITRKEAIPTKDMNKVSHSEFGDMMIRQFNIKKIDNRLHIYRDGIYISDPMYIGNSMLQIDKNIKRTKRTEVLEYLKIKILENTSTMFHDEMICFKNGVLDLNSEEVLPFNPSYIIMNKIPWNYNSRAYDKVTDETLNKICSNNKEVRQLLEEMVGYCFYRSSKFRKSFILTGKGKNGKSTFLKMLRYALDGVSSDNVSSLDLNDLNERFSKVGLYGKLANIGDDISEDDLHGKGISIFKKAVTGEAFRAEFKGENSFDMKSYATLIFAANTIPRFSGNGLTAIKDRLIIIPFNARFNKEDEDYNPNIMKDLLKPEAVEYLIRLGIEGLQRIIQNQGFTEPEAVQKELDDFEINNDSILSWLDSLKESDDESLHETVEANIIGKAFTDLYDLYMGFCVMEGLKDMAARRNFSKELCSRVPGLKKDRLNDRRRTTTYKWCDTIPTR